MGHHFVLVLVLRFGFQIHFYFYKWVFGIWCVFVFYLFLRHSFSEFLTVLELTL